MGNSAAQKKWRPCSQTWRKDLFIYVYIYIYVRIYRYAIAVGDTTKACSVFLFTHPLLTGLLEEGADLKRNFIHLVVGTFLRREVTNVRQSVRIHNMCCEFMVLRFMCNAVPSLTLSRTQTK